MSHARVTVRSALSAGKVPVANHRVWQFYKKKWLGPAHEILDSGRYSRYRGMYKFNGLSVVPVPRRKRYNNSGKFHTLMPVIARA
jgi:hypothetical protein